ncbi:TIR domain-containing protein [Herbidospora mongoliensis]|uniref:TIR domain-containing protein n=1 Tax=Herbidospora mongoliensis TaxID=688067 RepID=UPI000835ED4C|nr:TIR domain-containing protein [Herbidospora mongoliensis]
MRDDFRYDAFISYGSAADRQLARDVHRALHRLGRRWNQVRAVRVFRDDETLGVSNDLWGEIQKALDSSRFFILLASPAAAASRWVEREVHYWMERHQAPDRLLIVLTRGDLHVSLPAYLQRTDYPEPLYLDLSWMNGSTDSRAKSARLAEDMARLAAPLHGVTKDELLGMDRRRQRNLRRIILAVTATLGLLAALAISMAITATEQRDLARVESKRATSRSMILEAESLRETQAGTSVLLGAAALSLDPSANARASLVQTLLKNQYAGMLEEQKGIVTDIAISKDGTLLAAAYAPGGISLWRITGPRPNRLAILRGHDWPLGVDFSPDGRLLATVGSNDRMLVWGIADPTQPKILSAVSVDSPNSVSFSPDGRILATAGFVLGDSYANAVRLWDIRRPDDPRAVGLLRMGSGPISQVRFTPDGRRIIAVGVDRAALWNISPPTSEAIPDFVFPGLTSTVNTVDVRDDGHLIAIGDFDHNVSLWRIDDDGRVVRSAVFGAADAPIYSVSFAPDGNTLAIGSGDDRIALWNVARPGEPAPLAQLAEHAQDVRRVCFFPDGAMLVSGGNDGQVNFWRTIPWAEPRMEKQFRLTGGYAQDLAVTEDDDTLWISDRTGSLTFRDLEHPEVTRRSVLSRGGDETMRMRLSSDGHMALTDWEARNLSILWDVRDRESAKWLASIADIEQGASTDFDISSDGRLLLVGQESHDAPRGAILWDISNPIYPRRLAVLNIDNSPATRVSISQDGRIAAVGSGVRRSTEVTLWDISIVTEPRYVGRVNGNTDFLLDITFSPVGRILATSGNDQVTILWDIRDPERPLRLSMISAHSAQVTAAVFNPAGTIMATASEDGSVILWDVVDPTAPIQAAVLGDSTYSVTAVAFTSGADQVIAARGDGSIQIWNIEHLRDLIHDPLKQACDVSTRPLTQAEWRRYAPGQPFERVCN